jgi:hypothetical protein
MSSTRTPKVLSEGPELTLRAVSAEELEEEEAKDIPLGVQGGSCYG